MIKAESLGNKYEKAAILLFYFKNWRGAEGSFKKQKRRVGHFFSSSKPLTFCNGKMENPEARSIFGNG